MTAGQAAEYLGIEVATLRHHLRNGRVPAEKFGTQWLITKSSLDNFRDNPPKLGRPPEKPKSLPSEGGDKDY